MVIDEAVVLAGSYNWSRGAAENSEDFNLISSLTVAAAYVTHWSRPSRRCNFTAGAEVAINATAPVKVVWVGAAVCSDRRHAGLCCDHSAAIKPCAFGAPLRGCGA